MTKTCAIRAVCAICARTLLLATLAGCGQRGPLYLPADPPATPPATSTAPATPASTAPR